MSTPSPTSAVPVAVRKISVRKIYKVDLEAFIHTPDEYAICSDLVLKEKFLFRDRTKANEFAILKFNEMSLARGIDTRHKQHKPHSKFALCAGEGRTKDGTDVWFWVQADVEEKVLVETTEGKTLIMEAIQGVLVESGSEYPNLKNNGFFLGESNLKFEDDT